MASKVSSSLGLAAIFTIITMLLLQVAGAQVMTSPSYQLQSDSVNVGGGFSSSTNYIQESTTGEIATGPSDSSTYSLRAGYQQMQEVFISLSAPGDVIMDTALGGITGGESNGSTTVTVITDSPAGYQLTLVAENNPAMQISGGGSSIPDYSGAPDYNFTTIATDYHFGFSPTSVDAEADFLDNTTVCGSGSSNDLQCWDGLSTVERVISESSSSNHPSGATTTINFRVELGGSQPAVTAGLYIATSTLTAYPL